MVTEPDALQAYYALDKERDRLDLGVGQVEYLRTIEVVSRTLPPAPATVADIGGGPGRYTDWLVAQGYTVVHRDVVPLHVEHVRSRHADVVDSAIGDAREIDLDDGAVDAVLLLGPLYHLYDAQDRVDALREAARIVKPGGVVYAAAIARWAARLDAILVKRAHLKLPTLRTAIDQMESDGIMAPLAEASFTGYAHTPDQLRAEVTAAGLRLDSLVSLEGISFALHDLAERLADPDEQALLLDTLRATESVPDLLGVGPHLLASAVRTT